MMRSEAHPSRDKLAIEIGIRNSSTGSAPEAGGQALSRAEHPRKGLYYDAGAAGA